MGEGEETGYVPDSDEENYEGEPLVLIKDQTFCTVFLKFDGSLVLFLL